MILALVPSPTQVETNYRSLCSYYKLALGGTDWLNWAYPRDTPKRAQNNTHSGQLQTTPEHKPISSTNEAPKGQTQQAPEAH